MSGFLSVEVWKQQNLISANASFPALFLEILIWAQSQIPLLFRRKRNAFLIGICYAFCHRHQDHKKHYAETIHAADINPIVPEAHHVQRKDNSEVSIYNADEEYV